MTTELTECAAEMVKRRRFYAAAAVVRQLIECEYLLTLFSEDFDAAKRWVESTPDEIRSAFSPQKMRNLTGKFSNQEYWKHCSSGGHPSPKGGRFVEKLDPKRTVWRLSGAELTVDLGLHIHRVWSALDTLLIVHHSRYEHVRKDQRMSADRSWQTWLDSDVVVEIFTSS